jgi:hypothetical protein
VAIIEARALTKEFRQHRRGSSEVHVRVITEIVVKAAGRKWTGVFAPA